MKFIEIAEGISVRKEEIICVERLESLMGCKVITYMGAYESIYPYTTILMILEQGDIEEKLSNIPKEPLGDNLWGRQHFAG